MRRWVESLETRHGLDSLTERSRKVVLGSYVMLALGLVTWGVLLGKSGGSLRPLILFLLPLLLFLPSLLARRPRGHAWLAFVSLLYFMMGVNVAILPGLGWLGWLIVLAALALFTGCMFYARFRSRQLQARRDE